LVIGTLETIWSNAESRWAVASDAGGRYPDKSMRRQVVRSHEQTVAAITAGNGQRAEQIVRQHLRSSQRIVLDQIGDQVVTS
jgi:DNA-binding GntR family transcriptional regulator